MAIQTALDFKKEFNLDTEKIILTDITNYVGEGIALTDVVGVFKITDPNGSVIYENTNFGSPDIDADTSLIFGTVSVPKDAAGDFILGIYSITYTIRVSGAVQPGDYSKTETFDLCAVGPTVVITQIADCFCSKMTSTDATDYTYADADSIDIVRTHTIIPPAGSGLLNTVTALAAKEVTPIVTKTWSTTISTVMTYNFGDDKIVVTVTGNKEITINCDIKLCDVYCCINSLNTRYKNALNSNRVLAQEYFEKLERIAQLIVLFDQAVRCGKLTDGDAILDEILEVGDCTDECSCSDGVDPVAVVPLCGQTQQGIVTVVAGAGITVTPNVVGDDTEYTVKMADADKTKLDALKATLITTDTPAEIEITHPAGDPDEWKVNQVPGAIPSVMDLLNFRVEIFYDAAGMTYTFYEIKTQGTAFKTSGITLEGINETPYATWLNGSAKFTVKDFLVDEITPIKYKAIVELMEFTPVGPRIKVPNLIRMEQYDTNAIDFKFRILQSTGGVWRNGALKNRANPILLNILIKG